MDLIAARFFGLTRVTRIFQKKILIETTPGARAACRAGFFVARATRAAARGGFLVFAKKQGNTGDPSHAVSKRPKRESGRTAARDRQSGGPRAPEGHKEPPGPQGGHGH